MVEILWVAVGFHSTILTKLTPCGNISKSILKFLPATQIFILHASIVLCTATEVLIRSWFFFACLKAYDYGIPIFEGDIGNLRPLKNIIWKWLYYLDFTLFHVTMVMFEWNSFIFYWLLSNWWQPYAYMYRGFITIWFRQRNSNNRWRLILCLDDKFFKKV